MVRVVDLSAHGPVCALAVSPEGNALLAASRDGAVTVLASRSERPADKADKTHDKQAVKIDERRDDSNGWYELGLGP